MRKRIFLFVVLFINLQIILTEGNLSLCSSSISAQMHEVELNNVDVVAEAPMVCSYCGQYYMREHETEHMEVCPAYPVCCEKCCMGEYTRSTICNHRCPDETTPDGGRAIIVGVDEHIESPNGDKFTDHFVAIIGYSGTFPSNSTLIYAENAVSDEAGQFSDDNVLIWNGKSFSDDCSHNRNHDTYVVTQYRPNF